MRYPELVVNVRKFQVRMTPRAHCCAWAQENACFRHAQPCTPPDHVKSYGLQEETCPFCELGGTWLCGRARADKDPLFSVAGLRDFVGSFLPVGHGRGFQTGRIPSPNSNRSPHGLVRDFRAFQRRLGCRLGSAIGSGPADETCGEFVMHPGRL